MAHLLRLSRWLLLLVAAPLCAQPILPDALPPPSFGTQERALPEGLVHLRDVAPGIAQEMRYYTPYNFVGEVIDGYEAPECILSEPAARALAAVQKDLEAEGYGLKVYDCYRPQRAVDHFVRWAGNLNDERMKPAFYPDEPKRYLFSRGYIARRSGHSRASTVDLTVVLQPANAAVLPDAAYPDPAEGQLPRCDRPLARPTGLDLPGGGRLHERDLDMGTAYDCLSPLSATENPAVGEAALANRLMLRAAMMRRGFRNYTKEWWHYTLHDEPFPNTYFDVPVR